MKKIDGELLTILISIILFIISYFIKIDIVKTILLGCSYLVVSYNIFKNAFSSIKEKEYFDENTLMIISTIGAILIGKYQEAIMVILLYSIGEYLSDLAVNHSKDKISNIIDLRSNEITIRKNNQDKIIKIEEAKIGDIFIVKPGEKVALDGIIIKGNTSIDTSSLTGETIPKSVKVNDEVLSGTINMNNLILVKVTKEYNESTASKIMKFLEEADKKQNKTEKFITRFSKIYTPVIITISILIVVISILYENDLTSSIYTAIIFLVTSCPCALVLSIPLGYFCGIGRASKEGILIKGSKELENLSKIRNIVFDKTGTITKGSFEVSEIKGINVNEKELLDIAAHAEYYSNHPIATSILMKYDGKIDDKRISNFKEINGKGIETYIDGEKIIIGNNKLMKDNNIKVDSKSSIGTVVYIARENKYLGYIIISDTIKETSISAINDIKKLNIDNLTILSGDNEEIVKNVADKVKINNYKAGLLPMDKVKYLESIKETGFTAFVGDGMNDAPVLKISDLGISMGNIGSDIAIEASDVVIMKDDLRKIATAIKISKYTNKIVKNNITFAILMKLIILIMALFGYTTIWLAVFADVGVTLLTVLNTMRLILRRKY